MSSEAPVALPHLMNTYARSPVSFVRGQGSRLWDAAGREYLDATAGVAVAGLGHAHPAVAEVLAEQAHLLVHTSNLWGIEWQARLGERLARLSGLERAFFCNSGCEANEAAIKLARLHGHRQGIERPLIVVMEGAFHGRTLATLSASDSPKAQAGFGPLVEGFVRVPFGDAAAVRALARRQPGIVAVLLEPVQGESGVRLAPPGYLRQLRDVCDEEGWLLMLDEVQTGLGRTGHWFAFQPSGIRPDVMTLAKALGNGVPIGACLAGARASQLFGPGQHGSTFGGNPLACRAACTVLDTIEGASLPRRAAELGLRLLHQLDAGLAGHHDVLDIRGSGLMVGIELAWPCGHLVLRALHEQALLINVTRDTTVRLLPPLTSSIDDIDRTAEAVVRLVRTSQARQVA